MQSDKKYQVIYADPPWPCSGGKGKSSIASMRTSRPYKTMKIGDIYNLPISEMAEKDAILVLWSTWMHLPMAIELINKWGFRYATGKPWIKLTATGKYAFGPGTWFLHCSELLLIGRRGKPFGSKGSPRPATKGIIAEMRSQHSKKPESVRAWIESILPGPYLELFARQKTEGWDSWGNEVENDVEF